MARVALILAVALVAGFAPLRGWAQSIEFDESGGKEWRFLVTPYLFLPVTTTGTSTVAGATVDVDLDLSDVLDTLNFAAAARTELWKGNFGLMSDLYYTNIGGSGTIALPGSASGTLGVDIKVKQGWLSLMGAYRFAQGTFDRGGQKLRYIFDAGAGVRYNLLKQDVDATLSFDIGPGPGLQTSLGGTEVWWEPTLMLRGGVEVSDRWTLGARAEIGGFGAGGDDLQWIVLLGADYRPWQNTSLKLGWQFYGIDFSTNRSDGKFAYDVFQTGPYLGATFRF